MSKLIGELTKEQKIKVCKFYHCSDGDDKQYPECELKDQAPVKCSLHSTENLLEYLFNKEGEWQQPNSPYKGQWIPNKAKDKFVEKMMEISMTTSTREERENNFRKLLQDRQ